MKLPFGKPWNVIAKASLGAAILGVAGVLVLADEIQRSPYVTEVQWIKDQPVPFSHEHHVNGLGIDCRYCHTSVTKSASAGMPPAATCMNCHSQIWADAPMLEPVRDSFRTGKPIEWNRVHDLPDFVYFNHSIHITRGVGCTTCHGKMQYMPIAWKESTLYMQWCLECHRNPQQYMRSPEDVFNHEWEPSASKAKLVHTGKDAHNPHGFRSANVNCSVCHR